MNIAVATSCSDIYVIYLTVFIKSILKNNPGFNKDFYVFYDAKSVYRLSEDNIKLLKNLYDFKFVKIDSDFYYDHGKISPAYYSFDMFRLSDYDRVIWWGADMLCLKSLDELWEQAEKIEGIGMPKEKRRPVYNSGSMIVAKNYLDETYYRSLVSSNYDHIKMLGRDQKAYNIFFKDKIKEIPQKFNVLVTEADFLNFDDIVILHYIHKPKSTQGLKNLSNKHLALWSEYEKS